MPVVKVVLPILRQHVSDLKEQLSVPVWAVLNTGRQLIKYLSCTTADEGEDGGDSKDAASRPLKRRRRTANAANGTDASQEPLPHANG